MTATALAVPRALTPPERAKLRAQLKANLKIVSDDDADDAEELLDYALEMVEGGKAAGHVAEELLFMEMPVCGEAEAAKVGETLAAFFAGLENDSKDKDDAELQEWLVRIREKKSERLATVQKGRKAASMRDRTAGLEEGKAKKGVAGVPKTKEGEQSPTASLEKGKGKDDEGVLVGGKEKEEHDALPPASSMTVAELKEELRARNDSGYVPHSRLALEAALAAARKKDGADDAPQAALKESGGGQEEEKTEEGDVEEALPTAAGMQQPSIAIKQGSEKVDAKTARRDTGRQVKAWVTKPSQDCRLGIGLTGNGGTVRITSIAQDGLFARTNLKVGQVLGTINGERCETATEAVSRLYAAKGIAIVAYEEVGDIEQGATTASAGRSIFDGGSGGSAGRDDEVLADVAPGGSHAHPAANRDTKDDEGKGMGIAILVLLVISFALAFVPNSTITPYIAGVCLILALILTSSLTCHCCCAAGIELEDRDRGLITAALLAIVTMFVLGVVGAFVLSSNGMTITSGVTALGVISVVLNVAAIIFVGLFTWSSEESVDGCGRNWRDCRSFVRSNRRAVILSAMALAIVVAAAVSAAILVPQSKTPPGYTRHDNRMCQDAWRGGEWRSKTLDECAAFCDAQPTCVSFMYDMDNNVEKNHNCNLSASCVLRTSTEEDSAFTLFVREPYAVNGYPNCYAPRREKVGDGVCHLEYNTEDCGFDGDDCRSYNELKDRYPDCDADEPERIGDGFCDKIEFWSGDQPYYNEACGWDGDDCGGAPYGSTCSDDQQCASDLCLPRERNSPTQQCWTRGGNNVGEYCFVFDEVCTSNVCRNERCAESKLADYQRCEIDNDCESGACGLATKARTESPYYDKVCCASGLVERSVGTSQGGEIAVTDRLVMTITGVDSLEDAEAWRNITEEHVSDYYVVNDDAGVWNTEVDIEIVNVADVSTEGDNIWTFPEQAVEVVYTQTSYYKTADPELLDDVYVASQPFQTVQGVEAYIAALRELSRYYDGVTDVNLAFSPPTVPPTVAPSTMPYCAGVPKGYRCDPGVDNHCASGFCRPNSGTSRPEHQCWDGCSSSTYPCPCFANKYELQAAVDDYIAGGASCREGDSECEVINTYGWPIGSWCTSNVTDMSELFRDKRAFNDDLSSWDTSQVTSMEGMFLGAWAFNGDVSKWDTSKMTSMYGMFTRASSFNQDVSHFDTSQVTDMDFMFRGATSFNGDLRNFDTSKVTSMHSMFEGASSFNGDVSSFNTSKLTSMDRMFYNARSFNRDVGNFDTSNVTSMQETFLGTSSFNRDLSSWDTSKATTMNGMFRGSSFNQDLSNWDTSQVKSMQKMFSHASFNRDLSNWNTSQVVSMAEMFWNSHGTSPFNGDVSTWDISRVTTMSWMFFGASSFNGDVSNWDTSKVRSMQKMFKDASAFNGDVSRWDTSNVTSMASMFEGASSFNRDVSNWDTSRVASMKSMFQSATSFSQNLCAWGAHFKPYFPYWGEQPYSRMFWVTSCPEIRDPAGPYTNWCVATCPEEVLPPAPEAATNMATSENDPSAGYEYMGEGMCQDGAGNGYSKFYSREISSLGACMSFCDRFRPVGDAFRGIHWRLGPLCYCNFDADVDIEQMVSIYASDVDENDVGIDTSWPGKGEFTSLIANGGDQCYKKL